MSAFDMSLPFHAAAVFLTRPLTLICAHEPAIVERLRMFLEVALFTNSTSKTQTLICSPHVPAPFPVYLASLASGITWADWFHCLGGSAFTLFVKPTIVYVIRTDNGRTGVIWAANSSLPSLYPIISMNAHFQSLAQKSTSMEDYDGYESDSNSFADSASSRPSSRSSYFSALSLSSASSSSCTSKHDETRFPLRTFPYSKSGPTAAIPPPSSTKYIYQGGTSTVLTGGVMLGSLSYCSPVFRGGSQPATRDIPPRFLQLLRRRTELLS